MTPERQNEIWAMLPCNYQAYVKRWYEDVIDNNEPHEHIFEGLFGKHNLTAQAEEKPKYKGGDKVRITTYETYRPYEGQIAKVLKVDGNEGYIQIQLKDGYKMWIDEDWIEPYIEPKKENNPDSNIAYRKEKEEIFNYFDTIDYNHYRLDLTKEIAVQLVPNLKAGTIVNCESLAYDAVKTANEIVKRLKETEE